jgi:uncharacterized membrane protein (DUF4010 family)
MLVLLLSGVSFAGYLARKVVGRDRGYLAAGALGGLVSSTSITMSFARLSQTDAGAAGALAAGTIAANAMLFPRVLLTAGVLNTELAAVLWPWFVGPFLVAVAALVVSLRSSAPSRMDEPSMRNPLQLSAALKMAATFQLVMLLVDAASARWRGAGLLTVAAALGLTDIDALTVAMAGQNHQALTLAVEATAITVGVLSNTALKLALALVWGTGRFRLLTCTALLAIGATLVLQLLAR